MLFDLVVFSRSTYALAFAEHRAALAKPFGLWALNASATMRVTFRGPVQTHRVLSGVGEPCHADGKMQSRIALLRSKHQAGRIHLRHRSCRIVIGAQLMPRPTLLMPADMVWLTSVGGYRVAKA